MRFVLLIALLLPQVLLAGVGTDVFIRGKIGGVIEKERVKIIDSFDQSYFIEKKYFPQGFKFLQGESFMIEVPEEVLKNLEISKKRPSK